MNFLKITASCLGLALLVSCNSPDQRVTMDTPAPETDGTTTGNATTYEIAYSSSADSLRRPERVTMRSEEPQTGPREDTPSTLTRGGDDDDDNATAKTATAKDSRKKNKTSNKESQRETFKFDIRDTARLIFTLDSAMKIGKTYDVLLSIYTNSKDEAKAQSFVDTSDHAAKLQVKDNLYYMPDYKVTLHGNNFKVIPITDSVQHLYRHSVTTWNWQVEPQEGGRQKLTVVVAGFSAADDSRAPKDHFFIKHVTVQVGGIYLIREFATTNYAYTLYTSVMGVGIWYLQNKRKKRKRKHAHSSSEHKQAA